MQKLYEFLKSIRLTGSRSAEENITQFALIGGSRCERIDTICTGRFDASLVKSTRLTGGRFAEKHNTPLEVKCSGLLDVIKCKASKIDMLVTMYIRVFTEPHIKSLLFSKIKEFSLFHLIIVSYLVQND